MMIFGRVKSYFRKRIINLIDFYIKEVLAHDINYELQLDARKKPLIM